MVEIFSYCNRQCTYCPVSQVDNRRNNQVLDFSEYAKIINDLALIEYQGGLCLNLYNEPTAEKEILLERISYARKFLPNANIYFSSNGDYLSNEYLRQLSNVGLSKLYITLHVAKDRPYDDAVQMGRFCDLSVRLGKAIDINSIAFSQDIQGYLELYGIPIYIFSVNYYEHGVNRGGIVHAVRVTKSRTSPCDRPFKDFTVSYDGTIFPCCQFFVDNMNHKEKYAVGNLSAFETIYDAYASSIMAEWRRELFLFGEKRYPCSICSEENCESGDGVFQLREEQLQEFLKK